MTWTPPSGSSVDFLFGGTVYVPPSGDRVDLRFGTTSFDCAPEDLGLAMDLESVVTTVQEVVPCILEDLGLAIDIDQVLLFEGIISDDLGFAIDVDQVSIDQIYVARPDDVCFLLSLDDAPVEPRPEYELPVSVSGGMGIRFRKAKDQPAETSICFGRSEEINIPIDAGWISARETETERSSGWRDMDMIQSSASSGWSNAGIVEASTSSGFIELEGFVNEIEGQWKKPRHIEQLMLHPWMFLSDFGKLLDPSWSEMPELGSTVQSSWFVPPEVNVTHETLWGKKYYERICVRDYVPPPGDQVNFNLHQPIELCGDGDHVDFFFDKYTYDERCTHREPSGWRENYTYKRPKKIPRPPVLGVYIVLNNAMLCRLPDRTPVGVLSMSLSSKIDSWCWDFKAVLESRADLDKVRSIDGSPVPVEVEINGWKWVVMIEDSEGSRQFPKGSWSVSGRSLSAELASPYAPIKTYTESNQRLARQLAESELENTGWTFDWKIEDWLVPANVFSVTNQTPMETILKIVRSIGGEIQSHRTDKILKAVSRYPKSPWKWATETPVISLHESVVLTLGWSNERKPGYNGIYVSGSTAGGVTVFVRRDGTPGDNQAQMIVEPLITAVEAGRERGRVELSKAGKWSRQRLSLPLMSGSELPGLLNCGELIEVQEGSALWRGQISDVSITANRQNGLKVYQNIEVERYHG